MAFGNGSLQNNGIVALLSAISNLPWTLSQLMTALAAVTLVAVRFGWSMECKFSPTEVRVIFRSKRLKATLQDDGTDPSEAEPAA